MATTHYPGFNELNKEQQEFIREKKVSGNKPIKEWLEFFHPLALFDKKDDRIRRNGDYVKALWSFMMLFGVYMALMYLFAGMGTAELIPAILIIAVSSLLLLLTNQWFKKYETWDIPNLMRGFLEPFLEYLKKRAGAQTEMSIKLTLDEIYDLTDVEVEESKTQRFTYLQSSFKLPESGTFELNLAGMGTKRPYYSKYKLVHFVEMNLQLKGSMNQMQNEKRDFQVKQKDEKTIISDEYSESSNSPIESDTGPDLDQLSEKLDSMYKSVEQQV